MNHNVIALDGDGVLLDYNRAYATAWHRAFGYHPKERDPQAYWAMDRWEVERLSNDRLDQLQAAFDEGFWSTVPAMAGALEACKKLSAAGWELVCVSALRPQFTDARLRNLGDLGFPIDRVIATDSGSGYRSPKADALAQLRPVAFVDDYLPNFKGIPSEIHAALVQREPRGTPNIGPELQSIHSTHTDLTAFADWWLQRRRAPR
jgi:phosphoglycolate phosphatase-like HAD superfamily hydrolase